MKEVPKNLQTYCQPSKIKGREDMPFTDAGISFPDGGENEAIRSSCQTKSEWICYCFDISEKMIQEKRQKSGKAYYSEWIRQEIAAERCDCEAKNPSGHCCLGDVLALEKNPFKP